MSHIKITAVHPADAFYTKTKRHKDSVVGSVFKKTERTIEQPANCEAGWTFFDHLQIISSPKPIKDPKMTYCFYAVKFELVEEA